MVFDLIFDFLSMPLLEAALMTSNACQDLKVQCIYQVPFYVNDYAKQNNFYVKGELLSFTSDLLEQI